MLTLAQARVTGNDVSSHYHPDTNKAQILSARELNGIVFLSIRVLAGTASDATNSIITADMGYEPKISGYIGLVSSTAVANLKVNPIQWANGFKYRGTTESADQLGTIVFPIE